MAKLLFLRIVLFCVLAVFSPATAQTPAFPGAEGFGANSIGGRGGTVIQVTNLNDSGEGSLRNAVETAGPRIIVFTVSGTIELSQPLRITEPYITIAGQTAPGDGIALKNSGSVTNAMFQIASHDVTLRHLRSRPGPDNSVNGSGNLDALSISGLDVFNIIIDHVSMSWSVDETASIFRDAHDITIQWSIFSEALFCSNHQKTIDSAGSGGPCPGGGEPHSRVMTISTFPGDPLSPNNISLHHNLWAHGNKRYPNINSNTLVDFVNNVIYNLGAFGASLANAKNPDDAVKLNYVKNYVAPGPNTGTARSVPAIKSAGFSQAFPHQIFLDGNEVIPPILEVAPSVEMQGLLTDTRFPAPPITEASATQALEDVLAQAGATLSARDLVDHRVINDVMNGTGALINDPSDVGGWPELVSLPPPADSDADGVPDFWEDQFGLNKNDASDTMLDPDGDIYVNVEEYFNNTDPTGSSTTIVYISASDSRANEVETEPGAFRVTRTGSTGSPLTVNYEVGGTAQNGIDYQQLSGSIIIPAGESVATIEISPIGDSEEEGDEAAVITLKTGGNDFKVGCPSASLVMIKDSEPATSVEATGPKNGPKSFALFQNYPNPFNPETSIRFSMPRRADVTLKVFDVLGREVATLLDNELPAGDHSVSFNAKNLTSGVYFYRLSVGQFTEIRKALLMK